MKYLISKEHIVQHLILFLNNPLNKVSFLWDSFNDILMDNQDPTKLVTELWKQLQYYGSEHYLYDDCFEITDSEIILTVPEYDTKNIRDTRQSVIDSLIIMQIISYIVDEAYNIDDARDTTHIWEHLGLGGDDDVNYNSSYIDIIIEVIQLSLNINTLESDNYSLHDFDREQEALSLDDKHRYLIDLYNNNITL